MIYLNQADFTAALTSGYAFDNFNSIPEYTAQAHSYDFSENGFDWTASTTDYYGDDADNPAAILFLTDAGSIALTPAGGSTAGSGDALTFTFTSGNVTALEEISF